MRSTVMALPRIDGGAKGVTSATRTVMAAGRVIGGRGRGRRGQATRRAQVAGPAAKALAAPRRCLC